MEALHALGRIAFKTAFAADDVWRDDALHVDGLHVVAEERITELFQRLQTGDLAVPHVVLQGRPGIGKTHFLGHIRRLLQSKDHLFILYQPGTAQQFWEGLVSAYRDSLQRPFSGSQTQLHRLLSALLKRAGLPTEEVHDLLAGSVSGTELAKVRALLGQWVGKLPDDKRAVEVALALVLENSDDYEQQDVGQDVLQGEELDRDVAKQYSLRGKPIPVRYVVRAIDQLLGRAGLHAMIAIDQLDTLIHLARSSSRGAKAGDDGLGGVAVGLMDLAQDVRHSLIVLSCLVDSWTIIGAAAVAAPARYPVEVRLRSIPSVEVGKALASRYLNKMFNSFGFSAPDPLWPLGQSAFDEVTNMTPRDLLDSIQSHCRNCHAVGQVTLLESLADSLAPVSTLDSSVSSPAIDSLDSRLAELRSLPAVELLAPESVDTEFPAMIREVLLTWAEENSENGRFLVDPLPGKKPAIHARLRQKLSKANEDERHWSFRAIPHLNPNAAINRLKQAIVASGVEMNGTLRRLVILRNDPWSQGKKTQEIVSELQAGGARFLSIDQESLRHLAALARLRKEDHDGWRSWVTQRRPASQLPLLSLLAEDLELPQPPVNAVELEPNRDQDIDAPAPQHATEYTAIERSEQPEHSVLTASHFQRAGAILLGRNIGNGEAVHLPLEGLRRHMVVFGGSGSGKTVFLRRIIEGCALEGVSSIVLDINNDLARLGDRWPEPPSHWLDGDPARAEEYFAHTEVVIWTPRRDSGRPLTFDPLAGLAELVDDPNEFEIGVENAIATLLPKAALPQSGPKRQIGQAVLTEALKHYIASDGSSLHEFLTYLEALPEGVSSLTDAEVVARNLSQVLRAAVVTDPLFGGAGEHTDPGLLLKPSPGKRARISVISFIGLPQDEQRASFVAQLQMALFAWFKKHPAGDRPLGGLLVMDEAQNYASSSSQSASTGTTLALAQQARKFGLGLLFATQAPKGLHNQVAGNSDVQCFGKLSSPSQIQVVTDLARRKGGEAGDVVRLKVGQFFVSSENVPFQKIQAPTCLSFHPSSPLAPDEILSRSRSEQ